MIRTSVLVAVLMVLVTGCGSADPPAPGSSSPSSAAGSASGSVSPSPGATYFVKADSDAINAVAGPAQSALRRAQDSSDQCNRFIQRGYAPWRKCWHRLLDPVRKGVAGVGDKLQELSTRDFPAPCVQALAAAGTEFGEHAGQVGGLLQGIDSPRRAAQVSALKRYDHVLKDTQTTFNERFDALTPLCYSPEDLASITASPSPTS